MNPQNYRQVPQAQPPAQAYGSGAQARAMLTANQNRMPTSIPSAQPGAYNQSHGNLQAPTYAPATAAPQGFSLQNQPGQATTQASSNQPTSRQTSQSFPGQAAPGQLQSQPGDQPYGPANYAQQPNLAQASPQPAQINSQAAPAPQITENPISTQATLLISELRDSLVIMKDGSFRAVIACQSINFDLMSEQEREGVEYSYQNFLNSLNFSVQILVRSQRVDIGPYIEQLIKLRRNNDNMLLGVLMDDYINFIDILAQEANIMDKSFFIVVPYYGSADMERALQQTKNLFKTFGKNKVQNVTRINREVYNKAIDELNNRVETVISGLYQIGIHSVRLNTKELGTLFYNFNNPDTAVREPLVDFGKLATTYVMKGEKQ